MPKTKVQAVPGWVSETPGEECSYAFVMFDGNNNGVQEIAVSRPEFMALKAHLARMRGYPAPVESAEGESLPVKLANANRASLIKDVRKQCEEMLTGVMQLTTVDLYVLNQAFQDAVQNVMGGDESYPGSAILTAFSWALETHGKDAVWVPREHGTAVARFVQSLTEEK